MIVLVFIFSKHQIMYKMSIGSSIALYSLEEYIIYYVKKTSSIAAAAVVVSNAQLKDRYPYGTGLSLTAVRILEKDTVFTQSMEA